MPTEKPKVKAAGTSVQLSGPHPSRGVQTACVRANGLGLLRLSDGSKLNGISFHKDLRGLWTERQNTWHQLAFSSRPTFHHCQVRDTHIL